MIRNQKVNHRVRNFRIEFFAETIGVSQTFDFFFQLSGTADLFLNPSKASSAIFDYAIVYHERAFFIFGGGMKQGLKNTIARLDAKTATWSKVGILITGRRCHGARCSTLAPSLSGTPFFKGFEF